MFFNNKDKLNCSNCNRSVAKDSHYCPKCGYPQKSKEEKIRDFGLLGKSDLDNELTNLENSESQEQFGFTDKIINSLVSSLMKSFEKQFFEIDKDFQKSIKEDLQNSEIQTFPNGIRITMGAPINHNQKNKEKKPSILKKSPNQIQIDKLSKLPRASAKSSIKRLNNSLNYELTTPGVTSIDDIFISKLEEGYEVKAIGSKKVYTNSLPVNLPLKRLSLLKDKLLVEFKTEE